MEEINIVWVERAWGCCRAVASTTTHTYTHTPEQRGPHQERVSHSRPPRHCAESRQMRDQPCPAQPSALCPHVPFLNPWIYYFVSFVLVVWCSSVGPEASVCDLNLKPCLTIQHYHQCSRYDNTYMCECL